MKTEVYLIDITAYSDEFVKAEYEKISSHFISTDGERLSKRKESLLSKILLCRTLEKSGVREFQVHYKDSEKPRLISSSNMFFNISHSGRFVAVALSDSEVGCDIQEIKPYNPKVAKRNYCREETALIENAEDKDSIFIKLWALKESVLKYTGKGISGGLATYDFSAFADEVKFTAYGYEFYTFRLEDTFFALCYEGGNVEIIKTEV
ncbi:MAG: 4'-phosphopantetheinyl transferase superfamily protein [Clostridia bacterium]|nr:4'-phosphopantetheinyl transferase superfamily protein [Clostridia bacterium]